MKANCDVDLTFDVMRLEKNFDNLILLSGDGDFEILVRYFKEEDRNFLIFANAWSMARVFRYQYSKNVREFSEIKNTIEKQDKNGRTPDRWSSRGLVKGLNMERTPFYRRSLRGLVIDNTTK